MTTSCVTLYGLGAHLEQIDQLQVFPVAAAKVLDVSRAPNSSLADMERAVASDPVLAGRVLKLANSPLYGRSTPIASLDRAIGMLGFTGTRDVALALAIGGIGAEQSPYGQAMWRHALSTAWASKLLGRYIRSVDVDAAFITGLLHDVGLQLFLVLRPAELSAILAAGPHDGPTLLALEQGAFGTQHANLGAACLRRWGLPANVCAAVEPHHEADVMYSRTIAQPRDVALLQVADAMAEAMCEEGSVDAMVTRASTHPAARVLRAVRGAYETAAETLLRHREHLEQL